MHGIYIAAYDWTYVLQHYLLVHFRFTIKYYGFFNTTHVSVYII